MKDQLLDFKREFGIVNECMVYNTELKEFEYSESDSNKESIIQMDELGCFESLNYSYINIDSNELLIYKGKKLVTILFIQKYAIYNKALLAHKVKHLTKTLE
ncbi:MAG: hypothetical protein RIC35_08145 [Marinoscillum sp.]